MNAEIIRSAVSSMKAQSAPEPGIGECCGSFGELLQGTLPQSRAFLVTLPIRRYSRAFFSNDAVDGQLHVLPAHKWKAQRLARDLLVRRRLPVGGTLQIVSELPEGKGLASSTADLVATYRAIVDCHALQPSDSELHALLRAIEPSDGVMHEGIVAFLHQDVQLHEYLGPVPSLSLIAIDEGGQVDTLSLQRTRSPASVESQSHYLSLFMRMRHAVRENDLRAIGQISTCSAVLNQQNLPKRHLASVLNIARAAQALGVIAAHSGTCLGVILDTRDWQYEIQQQEVIDRLSTLPGVGQSVAVYHALASATAPATPRLLTATG